MRSKLAFLSICLILLATPALGCITNTPDAPATNSFTTIQTQVNTIQTDVNNLKTDVGKKVDLQTVTDLIKTFSGTGGGNTGYTKGEVYTRTEVDQAITTAINNLKTNPDQSWIKGGSSSVGGNSNVPLINNGDYSYRVYQKPGSPVYAGGQAYSWALEITNNTAKWKKLQLAGTLNPDTSVAGTGICTAWNNSFTSPSGTYFNCLNFALGSTNPTGVMPTYTTAGTPTPSIMFGAPGSNGTIFTLGAGEKKLIWVSLNLVYTSGVTQWMDPSWNISLSD
jgi:hypothetical protein